MCRQYFNILNHKLYLTYEKRNIFIKIFVIMYGKNTWNKRNTNKNEV